MKRLQRFQALFLFFTVKLPDISRRQLFNKLVEYELK